MRDEIRALQRRLGLSVVYVTHDREEALAVSDRIIVMDRGRIVEQGPPAELFESPRTRFVADFLAEANIVDGQLLAVDGEVGDVEIAGHVVRVPHRGHAAGEVAVAIRPDAITLHASAGAGGIPGRSSAPPLSAAWWSTRSRPRPGAAGHRPGHGYALHPSWTPTGRWAIGGRTSSARRPSW